MSDTKMDKILASIDIGKIIDDREEFALALNDIGWQSLCDAQWEHIDVFRNLIKDWASSLVEEAVKKERDSHRTTVKRVMNDVEFANLLRETTRRPGSLVAENQIPQVCGSHPVVSLHRETMCRFRDSYTRMMVFCSYICNVRPKNLTTNDMIKYLMDRGVSSEKVLSEFRGEFHRVVELMRSLWESSIENADLLREEKK